MENLFIDYHTKFGHERKFSKRKKFIIQMVYSASRSTRCALLVGPHSLGYTYYTLDLTPFARNTKQHKQSETVYLSLSLSMGKSIECQCLGLTLSLPEFSWRVVHLWALLSLVLHVWHTSWCPRTILPNRTLQPPVRQEK